MSTHSTLNTVPLAEAANALLDLDEQCGILPPECASELLADVQTLIEAAETFTVKTAKGETGQSIANVGQLLTHHRQLIATLVNVPAQSFTAEAATEVSGPAHRWRNLTLTLAIAAAASYHCHTKGIDAIVNQMMFLGSRTISGRRPLADDEVFLVRSYVAATFKPATDRRAGVVALVQAGLTPGETTEVSPGHFDDWSHPHLLLAPGTGHLASRWIELDRFAAYILGGLAEHHMDARHYVDRAALEAAPMTYKPRKNTEPGNATAAASAHTQLDNLFKKLGLFQPDVTASSLTQWRVRTAWKDKGIDYAWAISGRASKGQMWEALNLEPATGTAVPVMRPLAVPA